MIYLDHAATSPVAPEVLAEVQQVQQALWGNPSSTHRPGTEAARRLDRDRRRFAGLLGCDPGEIVFTSGGTESNNMAIKGLAASGRCRHLLVSAVEHPSVLEAARAVAERGCKLTELPVDGRGRVREDAFERALESDVGLVSVQHANNEVGTLQPVLRLAALARRAAPDARFHVDAVQSLGWVELPLASGRIDMVSFSAHKIGGPRGVGALYVRKGLRLAPLLDGGGQERGLRSGTENVAGVAGFVKAAELALGRQRQAAERTANLREQLWLMISQGLPGVRRNTPADGAVAHILSLRFPGLKAQNVLHFLEDRGVVASSGSACHAGRRARSHVLDAMGIGPDQASLRLSLSAETSAGDVEQAAAAVVSTIEELNRGKGR